MMDRYLGMGMAMRRIYPIALSLLLGISIVLPAFADKLTVIAAPEASREAFQVNTRIGWKNDLEAAKKEAAKSNKMIFWVHMLGSMDGKT